MAKYTRKQKAAKMEASITQQEERHPYKSKNINIIPRNNSQKNYLYDLQNEENDIVIAFGPAGTGKTMIATQYAMKQLCLGKIKKIIITRPAVSVEEKHGFLPGDLKQKMEPWVIPILDVFKEVFSPYAIEKMIEDEVIEIAPLAFMRGRTLKNAIIIADEMQNAVPSQMKMLLTRIGDNSRMFITGDLEQHDRGYEENGLKDFLERYRDFPSDRIKISRFSKEDVERHPVVQDVLDIYN